MYEVTYTNEMGATASLGKNTPLTREQMEWAVSEARRAAVGDGEIGVRELKA